MDRRFLSRVSLGGRGIVWVDIRRSRLGTKFTELSIGETLNDRKEVRGDAAYRCVWTLESDSVSLSISWERYESDDNEENESPRSLDPLACDVGFRVSCCLGIVERGPEGLRMGLFEDWVSETRSGYAVSE